MDPKNPNSTSQPLFASPLFKEGTKLLPARLISSYKPFSNYESNMVLLPPIHKERIIYALEPQHFFKQRGAPIKLKNNMVKRFNLKNTKGKKFKFSFVIQILIAHLHHLAGKKAKVRYSRCSSVL